MFRFNAAISNLALEELPLIGNKYTWTNSQEQPLLERLDWFFVSVSWTLNYPGSTVHTLSRETSDHYPCVVKVSTDIPKPRVFRFENYWLLHDDFIQVMQHGWNVPTHHMDKAKKLVAKFKNLRRVLKAWQKTLSNLATVIANNKTILLFIDTLEEFRDLSIEEWNFRLLMRENLDKLLQQQLEYWRQRGKIKWVKLGDENSKFFHATATIQMKKNIYYLSPKFSGPRILQS